MNHIAKTIVITTVFEYIYIYIWKLIKNHWFLCHFLIWGPPRTLQRLPRPSQAPPKIKEIIQEIYDLVLWNIMCSQLPKSSFRWGRVTKTNDIPCGPWSPFRAPRRAPKVNMSVSLGTCDKNWNTWKNMEILIFNYVYKTNEILNILKPVLARNGKRVYFGTAS